MAKKYSVNVKFDKETLDRIDTLVEKKKFDSRSSFVRRAVIEYLPEYEEKILS